MSAIQVLFQQAQLAEAAYADFLNPSISVEQALKNEGMSATQAAAFIQNWRVVSQFSESGVWSNGFSATLFEKVNPSLPGTQYTLAFRGSQEFRDFAGADLDLAVTSVARNQLISMVNYVLRLQVGATGFVQQLNASGTGLAQNLVGGVGLGIDPDLLTVNGHSLGGYLAQVYQRVFGSGGVFTYNALGVTDPNASFFNQVTNLLGLPAGTFGSGSGENLVVPGEPAHLIGTVQGKPQIQVFSETQSTTTDPNVNTISAHRIPPLTDSLALYDLFAKIDPSLDTTDPAVGIGKITDILKTASSKPVLSLEAALDSLKTLFKDPVVQNLTPTPTDDRNAFYTNLYNTDFQNRISGYTGLLSIVPLTDKDAFAIEANALGGIGYRYALKALNPFVVLGEAGIYDPHNLNSELDIYDSVSGNGTLTAQWVADRAKFLAWKMSINAADRLFGINTTSGDNAWYQDKALNENAYVLSSSLQGAFGTLRSPRAIEAFLKKTDAQRIFFGSDAAGDALDGGAKADFLYGGGGDDRLNGLGGDDYLQGDKGDDRLSGGAQNDILVGGKGADVLDGGLGNDTYVWNKGDGFDTITDAREGGDGAKLGIIQFLNQSLAGTKTQFQPDNPQLFTDQQGMLYALTGTPGFDGLLTIVKPGEAGGLRIEGFKSGDFGIVIPVPAAITKTDKFGTAGNDLDLAADAPNQKVFGLEGNDRIMAAFAGAEAYGGLGYDYLTNDTGEQRLFGEAGNDILVASAGNDELYGGADNDVLQGGGENDFLDGGDGGDILDGGPGADVILGGAGNDFIVGGGTLTVPVAAWDPNTPPVFGTVTVGGVTGMTGATGFFTVDGDEGNYIDAGDGIDTVYGGDGDDFAIGGLGADLLVGLAGDDVLWGGEDADTLFGDGTQGSVTTYTLSPFHGNDALVGGLGNDFLQGDGGADELFGEEGDDTLVGDASGLEEQYHGADYLDGGAGNDRLIGYGKDDTLIGGAGDDTMDGDSNTVAAALHGNDYLDGGDDNDDMTGSGGSDVLFGGAGNDLLFGDSDDTPIAFQGDDFLDGEAGDDFLRGYGGEDTLAGGEGNDQLLGGAGNDSLHGGPGNDTLVGGPGKDTYLFNRGDGIDTLDDSSGAEASVLVLGPGISASDIKFRLGSLRVDLGQDDAIHVNGFNPDAPFATPVLDAIQFADGSTMSYQDVLAQGFDLEGTETDDVIEGTAVTDRIDAKGGNDRVIAKAGNDTLLGGAGDDDLDAGAGNDVVDAGAGNDLVNGGAGDDRLEGGAGEDTYVFDYGMGRDTLMDTGGRIALSNGLGFETLRATRQGNDLLLSIRGAAQGALLKDYDLAPQNWVIRDAAGAQTNPEAILAATEQAAQNAVQSAWDDHASAYRAERIARYQAEGYRIGADGVLRRSPAFNDTVTAGIVQGTTTTTRVVSLFSGGGSTNISTTPINQFNVGSPSLLQGTATLQKMTTVADDPQISARFPALTQSFTGENVLASIEWNWASLTGTETESVSTTGTFIFGPPDPGSITGRGPVIGTVTETIVTRLFGGAVNGAVTGVLPLGAATTQSGFYPAIINVSLTHRQSVETIEEIRGGPGNNTISFNGANSLIDAGAGDDVVRWSGLSAASGRGNFLYGNAGADRLSGGAGADVLVGGTGNDTLDGAAGADTYLVLPEDAGFDILDDTGNNHVREFEIGNYSRYFEWYYRNLGINPFGDAPLPLLPRIAANDYAALAPLYASGVIERDTVEFAEGIGLADLRLSWGQYQKAPPAGIPLPGSIFLPPSPLPGPVPDPGEFLYTTLDISWAPDRGIRVVIPHSESAKDFSQLIDPPRYIGGSLGAGAEQFRFADGTVLSMQQMIALAPPAPSFDPQPDNILTGTAGNDTLTGSLGNDTYLINAGGGVDRIIDGGGVDTLTFGSGITSDMLALGLGSLLIRIGDSGDAIHIEGFDPRDALGSPVIENFRFADGTTLTYAQLIARGFDITGTAGDDALTGTSVSDRMSGLTGNDTLEADVGDDVLDGGAGNDVLIGRSGNDRLSGGPGDDILVGGEGDDTYVYRPGDGFDMIADEAGNDAVAFGTGLTRDNVVARMSEDDSTARVRVLDSYGNEQADQGLDVALGVDGQSPIEWFTFADGDSASLDDLLIRKEVHTGTRRNDVIRAGRNDDTIYADRGNDVVYAGSGHDMLFGDRGRDVLYGEAGNDALVGGRGKDKLYGGSGDDMLEGGRGSDLLDGGAGFNTYVFERGFGDDRIASSGGSGALRFGAGITARDLSFKRRDNDLVIKVHDGGRIRIEGWFDPKAAHPVERAEFADGTVLNADKFVAKGYANERERDEDDDDDSSQYAHDDDRARPHDATNDADHDDVRSTKTQSNDGKSGEIPDSVWFEKVVEKWNAHSGRPDAQNDNARGNTQRHTQYTNRWQRMHDQLNAHLTGGENDENDGGADLASLKPGFARGLAFTQFGPIGYGGVGVEDRGAADLRLFTGLKEGLARIA